jgi:Flp pilus assembly pilin Flp
LPGFRAGGSGAIQQTRAWRVKMKNLFVRFVREDAGQDLIEYAILIGLITVGLVATVTSIGTWTKGKFTTLNGELNP